MPQQAVDTAPLTQELWSGIESTYDAILLAHPFLTGLTDGSLPHPSF